MKRKKKLITLLLLFAIGMIPLGIVLASGTRFYMEVKSETGEAVDAQKLQREQIITIPISLEGASEFTTISYELSYDQNAFEVLSATNELSSSDFLYVDPNTNLENTVRFGAGCKTSNNICTHEGKMGTVKLKVKKEASGKYDFKLKINRFTKIKETGADSPSIYEPVEHEVSDTLQVKVEVPATDITLNVENEINKIGGETFEIQAIPKESDTTTEENLKITTDMENVVSVNQNQLTAKETGTAHITVNAYGIQKQVTVHVTNPISKITLNRTNLSLQVGSGTSSFQLTFTTTPENPDDKRVTWKSTKEEVARVTDGLVEALQEGNTTIQVISVANGEVYAECNVNVSVPVTKVNLPSKIEMEKYQTDNTLNTVNISYTMEPAEAKPVVTFTSSNPEVVDVSKEGIIKVIGDARNAKDIFITMEVTNCLETNNEDHVCTYQIPVEVKASLKGLNAYVNGKKITEINDLYPNEQREIQIEYDPYDATDVESITWESDNDTLVKVENGKITALQSTNKQPVYITAKVGTKEIKIPVIVKTPVDPNSGVVTPSESITLYKNCDDGICEEQLKITFTPANADEHPTITWQSENNSIATIDENGLLKATGKGSTTILATYQTLAGEKVTKKIQVTVLVPLKKIEFRKSIIEVERGNDLDLQDYVIVSPEEALDKEERKNIQYELSEDSYLSIQGSVIHANKLGTTSVVAKINGKTATIIVKVIAKLKDFEITQNNQVIKELRLNKEGSAFGRVSETTLSVLLDPVDTTDPVQVLWSSEDDDIVSVNENGFVQAKKEGKTTIKAQIGDKIKTIPVQVVIPVMNFSLESTQITMLKNTQKTIHANINPENATEELKTITWKSLDERIATISTSGVITAKKEGKTTILATLPDGLTSQVEVTVKIIPLEDFEMDIPNHLLLGSTKELHLTPKPLDTTEVDHITYEVEDENIVEIKEGILITKQAGSTKVKVTVGNITKEYEITVEEIKAQKITIEPLSKELSVGDEEDLWISVTPENTTEQLTYTYTSSDEAIVSVDENGHITANAPGTATITVTASNGLTSVLKIVIKKTSGIPQTGNVKASTYFALAITFLGSLVGMLYIGKKDAKKN